MIVYSPTDGDALTSSVESLPRHCFLITGLGKSLPDQVIRMREELDRLCRLHEDFSDKTLGNLYFELGIAQAMGKETVVVKSPRYALASDLVRTEYIEFDDEFEVRFGRFLDALEVQASHYQMMAEQLERNPVLSLDYLRRAFLLTGDESLRDAARELLQQANLDDRARNSVEVLGARF